MTLLNIIFVAVAMIWAAAGFKLKQKDGKLAVLLIYSGLAIGATGLINMFIQSFVFLILVFAVTNMAAMFIYMKNTLSE